METIILKVFGGSILECTIYVFVFSFYTCMVSLASIFKLDILINMLTPLKKTKQALYFLCSALVYAAPKKMTLRQIHQIPLNNLLEALELRE
jgi:hypothetical protein